MPVSVGLTKKPLHPSDKASIASCVHASRSWIFRVVLDLMKDPSLMIVRCNSNCSREHSVYNSPVYQCVQQPTDEIVFFFQAEDGIRDHCVTGVQTCALPISTV